MAAVVRVGLDGTLREGDLPPIQGAVVAMHTAMYADRPDVGCVLHTHSPYATAYAVAQRPIGCWIEALAMFGLPDGVPVAGYGPRGSEEAVANIRAAVRPASRPCCWPTTACWSSTARPSSPSWSAASSRRPPRPGSTRPALGGPVEIPEEMRAAALQRAMAYAAAGTARS